jgi:ABC-type uncharacterized transport system ATPase subunit
MIGADRRRCSTGRQAGAVVLAVQGPDLPRQDPFGVDLQDIGFDVRAGEIVGMAGVSGNGQQELMAALSGEDPRAPAGSDHGCSARTSPRSPRQRRQAGACTSCPRSAWAAARCPR